jgi:hypothetical protein
MSELLATIVDCVTGNVITRPCTKEELAVFEQDKKEGELAKKALVEKNAAREALLVKLGITAEEAALLLG